MQVKAKHNWKSFLSLSTLFGTNSPQNQVAVIEPEVITVAEQKPEVKLEVKVNPQEVQQLEKEVDSIIKLKSYDTIFQMIRNGYILTKKQQSALDDIFSEAAIYNRMEVPLFLEKGYQMGSKAFFELLSAKDIVKKCKDYLCDEKDSKELLPPACEGYTYVDSADRRHWNFHIVAPALKEMLKQEKYQDMAIEVWHSKLYDNESFKYTIEWPYELFKQRIFSKNSLENLGHIATLLAHFNNINPAFIERFQEDLKTYKSDSLSDMVTRAKILYMDRHLEQAVNDKEAISSVLSLNNLPLQAQNLIKQIEVVCQSLQNAGFHGEAKYTFDNIVDKILPQTIRKYLMMDEGYRLTMRDANEKNAQDHLLDSLQGIHETVIALQEQKNANQLLEMSANSRYVASVKRNIAG